MKKNNDLQFSISAAILPNGNPVAVMDMISEGKITAYYCAEILDEYIRVLAYEKLKIAPKKQAEIILTSRLS